MPNDKAGLPVLVVAPFGRDGDLICETLERANIRCEMHHDPRRVFPRLSNGTGALLVEEEALNDELVREFAMALQNQPAWSDAPVIMLTKARSTTSRMAHAMARMRQPLGHTTLLERPLRPEILVSTVETVLRARRRQFQIRDAVERLQASEARYRSLILAAGARTVVVGDLATFQARFGTSISVAGEFAGDLSNGGEDLRGGRSVSPG